MIATRRRKLMSATANATGGVLAPDEPLSRLESSFTTLNSAGAALSERFFERLFGAYPTVRDELPPRDDTATAELLDAIRLILAHRRDPAGVRAQLQALGRRHAAQGVRPPHYRLICEVLVRSMADLCGPDWDAELECEWTSSLNLGAAAMIEGAATGGSPRAS